MNSRRSQLSHGSTDEIGPEDIFRQVLGRERSGRLRMCGGGVALSDIWADIPTRGTQQLLMAEQRNIIASLQEQTKVQAEQIKEQGRLLAEVVTNMSQNNNPSNQSMAASLETNQ
jgi:hypothetical protein